MFVILMNVSGEIFLMLIHQNGRHYVGVWNSMKGAESVFFPDDMVEVATPFVLSQLQPSIVEVASREEIEAKIIGGNEYRPASISGGFLLGTIWGAKAIDSAMELWAAGNRL